MSLSERISVCRVLCWRGISGSIAAAFVAGLATLAAEVPLAHPLDPLTKQEILETVEVMRKAGKVNRESRFSLITLHEPPKQDVLSYKEGTLFRRESFAVVYERARNQTFEAIVDLRKNILISWKQIPGVQPSFLLEDADILQRAVRADPRFAEAMHRRGIVDLENVGIGDWPGGYYGDAEERDMRFRRAVFGYHDAKSEASRPIENVTADVNLNTGKVMRFVDGDIVPIPPVGAGIESIPTGPLRTKPKPLEIVQAQGPSFEIRAQEVRWQQWRFRFALNGREGLVLYTVGYEDGGRVRSVLYRGSCSEMVVPYGDPSLGWFFKNAFDAGEDSMGRYASVLESQTDYPNNAVTFDATLANEQGDYFMIPRAIALYERDGGLGWKHFDKGRERNESRRARELVLSWIATVGNYDYAFNWVFHQDGILEMEVGLTGYMDTKAVNLQKLPNDAHTHELSDLKYGHLVAENLVAVHHQHFFNFRLDLDIDGITNSVLEMNTAALPPSPSNPYLNAFTMNETIFSNEREAARQMDLGASRRWTVFNPSAKNALGYPASYTLVGGENSLPYAAPESWIRKRANFIDAHFWATPYDPEQLYAAGFYANQSRGDDGLARWIEADRPIKDRDVVIWYTMGITHIPRVEEHPVMSVHKAGFQLVPNGFFNENPAVNLPK
jgi:primary-amine oxidase